MNDNTDHCRDCKARKFGDSVFHEIYCYDLYIPSGNEPRSKKQEEIDDRIEKEIVKPLEERGYKCYHGCRDYTGGGVYMQAFTEPLRVIPVTILPVYQDPWFSRMKSWFMQSNILRRTVLLLFEPIDHKSPFLKTCFSLNAIDSEMAVLLPKLCETIEKEKAKFPLEKRLQLAKGERDSEMSSTTYYEVTENSSLCTVYDLPDRRDVYYNGSVLPDPLKQSFDRNHYMRGSFRGKKSLFPEIAAQVETKENIFQRIKQAASKNQDDVLWAAATENEDEKIRKEATSALARVLKRNLIKFSKQRDLKDLEQDVQKLILRETSADPELLYRQQELHCYILAAFFLNTCISKNLDIPEKMVSPRRAWKRFSFARKKKTFSSLCQRFYQKFRGALYANLESAQQSTSSIVQNCISLLEKVPRLFEEMDSVACRDLLVQDFQRNMKKLPWAIRNIFLVIITEKIFEENQINQHKVFLQNTCVKLGNKEWGCFLGVVERVTDYMLKGRTYADVDQCKALLERLWTYCQQKSSKKSNQILILSHFFQKLVYHPVKEVRNYFAPTVFFKTTYNVSRLGQEFAVIKESLANTCIVQYLEGQFSGITFKGKHQKRMNTLVLRGTTYQGDVKIYVSLQQTLNDALKTNHTDEFYIRFHDLVFTTQALCQDSENDFVAKLWKANPRGPLPFYALEDHQPLLRLLHDNENHLHLSNMLEIFLSVAKAVHYCHDRKLLLRDITPASFTGSMRTGNLAPQLVVKLSSFLMARSVVKDQNYYYSDPDCEYDTDATFHGDTKEALAVRFSAPVSLKKHEFSFGSDTWMVAITYFSVLSYGRQPYLELDHMNTQDVISEVIEGHKAQKLIFIPDMLYDIIASCLDLETINSSSAEDLVVKLENYKLYSGDRIAKLHITDCISPPIDEGNIERGYLDDDGIYVPEKTDEPQKTDLCADMITKGFNLKEVVSVRMSLETRKALLSLSGPSFLCIDDISYSYSTTLSSEPLVNFHFTLLDIAAMESVELQERLDYLQQIAQALRNLHDLSIIHCDVRACNMFVFQQQQKVKVGRFGRAVYLPNKTSDNLAFPNVYKLMPEDAVKWSPPEVQQGGVYSRASDVFMFGIMIWESLLVFGIPRIYFKKALKPFCNVNSCQVLNTVNPRNLPESIDGPLDGLFQCMKSCWNPNPTKRPSFHSIIQTFGEVRSRLPMMSNTREYMLFGSESSTSDEIDYNFEENIYENILEYEDVIT